MTKATVDWDSAETWKRVLASVYATGVKIDLKKAAMFFGTNYNTLQCGTRSVRDLADALQADAGGFTDLNNESIDSPARKSTTSTPRKPRTPKKGLQPLDNVTNGRVSKKTPPPKKSKPAVIAHGDFALFNPLMPSFDDIEQSETKAPGLGFDPDELCGYGMGFS